MRRLSFIELSSATAASDDVCEILVPAPAQCAGTLSGPRASLFGPTGATA